MSKQKKLGQVPTPKWVVDEILELIGYNDSFIVDKYILEPSCGDGVFLNEIIICYIEEAKKLGLSNIEIVKGLETYIYGIELDEDAYDQCIYNLNQLTQTLLGVDNIKWNIFNQNTLYIYHQFKNKFDYIVGNPPYIRIHNLDDETRNFIKDNFKFTDGSFDIYSVFFEMGFEMIKNTGKIGYITSNSFLLNSSYKKFREFLKFKQKIQTLIDFQGQHIFKGFSTYTVITIIDMCHQEDYFIYKELINDKLEVVNHIKFKDLNMNSWVFTNADNENKIKSIKDNGNTVINELFDVQYGFATQRDKVFITNIKEIDGLTDIVFFNDSLMETKILKTCVKASKFKGTIDNTFKIIFPYKQVNNKYIPIPENELKIKYPFCYEYLEKNKEELLKRDSDKNASWYEYGRSQGIQTMHKEKIIVNPIMLDKPNFYIIDKDVLMYSGIFITKKVPTINWDIITNALNSEEFIQLIKLTSKNLSGGYKTITTKQIKDFTVTINDNNKLFN